MRYLHDHPQFEDLLRIINGETGIDAYLVEKDYWIMHALYGLKKLGFRFELKGGTSLSKGFKIIDRFSEDIDLHITPPVAFRINENPNNCKEKNVKARSDFFGWLATEIQIDGIIRVERDREFDDACFRSAGIRLFYQSKVAPLHGVKEGILLEAGFDNVTPNQITDISSWALDYAQKITGVEIANNVAKGIVCYNPEYTFVEKLQTIATKFRNEQQSGVESKNYMRQYYDVFCLLEDQRVLSFLGTKAYQEHKQRRFPLADLATPLRENEAFLLNDPVLRQRFAARYHSTSGLYYKGQPPFESILGRIRQQVEKL